jgi:hypothetical protein
MIDAKLATEYIASCQELLETEDKVHQLILQAGDASMLRDWKHWNPDEILSILDLLRLDRWSNGKDIAAALKTWTGRRYAVHKKYGEIVGAAGFEEFLRIPKPDRVDRGLIGDWQAYYNANSQL